MSDPDLSIVIPVFNSEMYLPECLDSLLEAQGIENTEIIIVDDGSSDKSYEIASGYISGNGNIRIIRRENGGPSAARNAGLFESTGRYVFFCDSDDSVVPGLFARIIRLAGKSSDDIILWDSALVYETFNPAMPKNRDFFAHEGLAKTEKTYTGKELLETSLRRSGDFVATVWLGAYRRDFLLENDLFFEEGLIHEDELLLPKIFIKAGSVHYIPEKIYKYRIHEDSIMNPKNRDRARSAGSLMRIYPELYGYYDEVLEGEPLKDLIESNLTKRYIRMIYKYRIWRYGYGRQIDKKRLWKTSGSLREKILILPLFLFGD